MKDNLSVWQDIICECMSLEEFEKWVGHVSFNGYKEGYNDGAANKQYEIDEGVA